MASPGRGPSLRVGHGYTFIVCVYRCWLSSVSYGAVRLFSPVCSFRPIIGETYTHVAAVCPVRLVGVYSCVSLFVYKRRYGMKFVIVSVCFEGLSQVFCAPGSLNIDPSTEGAMKADFALCRLPAFEEGPFPGRLLSPFNLRGIALKVQETKKKVRRTSKVVLFLYEFLVVFLAKSVCLLHFDILFFLRSVQVSTPARGPDPPAVFIAL